LTGSKIARFSLRRRIVFRKVVILDSSTPPRSIATPCVKVCIVDGASGLCLGCYRTLAEIGGWSGLSDERRAAVMAELPTRRDRIDPALRG